MDLKRIDSYEDCRFSESALMQHGCFLVDGIPYEIEIISDSEAMNRNIYTPMDMVIVSHSKYTEK